MTEGGIFDDFRGHFDDFPRDYGHIRRHRQTTG
jgi:hypothetical protein